MLDRLVWSPCSDQAAREIMAQVVGATDPTQLASFDIRGLMAPLPFYKHWKLVWLLSAFPEPSGPTAMEDVYALWREGHQPLRLDGDSMPIHTVNEDESLRLTAGDAPDYIRFFCFFVRAEDEPFVLYEEVPESAEDDEDALKTARPLTPKGSDPEGNLLYDATIIFTGAAFNAVLKVPPNGELEMLDDDPLSVTLAPEAIPRLPGLGLGPTLRTYLARVLPTATPAILAPASRGKRAPGGRRVHAAKRSTTNRPAIVQMVELLLERALVEQSKNRLIGYFNATQPHARPLDQFAALMLDASPVVIVETNMPFVEETIGEIVNERIKPPGQLRICSAVIPGDNMPLDFTLPSQGPALVLMPLQVYRTVAQVERVAFDIAARDLAAVIACERFGQLPESLRQIKDVVLRLPAMDAILFATLFKGVMGHAPPANWEAKGTDWVKHLLPTDFEHPRRMKLPRDKALAYIRAQVIERLSDVDPKQGLSLNQLYGLGEARQFAEDLIADIHAATSGQLPWSQVDRGALLVGAPGTGKTTLAKAIAKDCGVRFVTASAAGWQAAGESLGPHIVAIRRTFSEARNYAPSIMFIDEIDSIGNREEFAGTNNAVYQTEVVNAVLEEMEGLDPAAPVFVIGATNHEERVDPALRRSGRMDRVIRIPRPNSAALDQIYQYYIGALGSGMQLDPAVDTVALGRLSVGLTGADVERIVRGAARRARKAGRPLSQADVIAEVTNQPRGTEAFLTLTPADLERTATHEAGHALALSLTGSKGSDIGFVTIVPRDDGTLGFVAPLPDERVHLTLGDYEDKLDVFLAGRAAEEIKYGAEQVSSGACSDLESATALVTRMLTKLGLGGGRRFLWSESASAADLELAETVLARSYDRVLGKLGEHRPALEGLAQALVDRQELTGDEVRAILSLP